MSKDRYFHLHIITVIHTNRQDFGTVWPITYQGERRSTLMDKIILAILGLAAAVAEEIFNDE